MMRLTALLAAAAMALAPSVSAAAQTQEEIERYKKMTIFAVGVAAAFNAEPYRGLGYDDPNILAVPFYIYNKNNLTLAGPNISYRFWRVFDTQLSAEAKYRFQNYDSSDSPFLTGMSDRQGAFEVGLKAAKRYGRLRLQAETFADVSNTHEGYEFTVRGTFELGDNRAISFRPVVGATWQSRSLNDYYYGVGVAEALDRPMVIDGVDVFRPAYEAGSAVVPFAGVNARTRLSRRLQVTGTASIERLPNEITSSPIVGEETRTTAFLAVSYMFSGPGVTPMPGERRGRRR
ncbi:MAG: MipA/OmpV family protein [Pseudomonadota bacterium]